MSLYTIARAGKYYPRMWSEERALHFPSTYIQTCVNILLNCLTTREDNHFDAQTINLVTLPLKAMVTGIGFCGRRGQRKRERQLQELSEYPERFHFYPPLRKRNRKLIITSKDGKKTIKRF